MSKVYYVYAYLRSKDSDAGSAGTPYYVGKGTGKRRFAKHGKLRVPKDKTKIVLLEQNLTEVEAHKLEIELIAKYGRKDNKTGILHNRTDGGEGSSGCYHTEEYKIAQSARMMGVNKGIKRTPEQIVVNSESHKGQVPWHKGRTGYFTEEQLKRIGDATRARGPQSEETKAKRSKAMLGKNKGKKLGPSALKGIKRGPQSEETKAKRSESMKKVPGRIWTEEEKIKKSAAMKKPWSAARREAQLNRGK